ncbi:lipoprotein [Spiroplasma endosymbiont of Othius punctulatus]|uniref:lipoprotein n=1 Tax=Spiroplasma endosymbiont of Othius punctulatus TaxID=3066289 RepID=UPI0030D1476D
MKKLLALLGAAGVIVSAGAVVVSCGPDAPTGETPSDPLQDAKDSLIALIADANNKKIAYISEGLTTTPESLTLEISKAEAVVTNGTTVEEVVVATDDLNKALVKAEADAVIERDSKALEIAKADLKLLIDKATKWSDDTLKDLEKYAEIKLQLNTAIIAANNTLSNEESTVKNLVDAKDELEKTYAEVTEKFEEMGDVEELLVSAKTKLMNSISEANSFAEGIEITAPKTFDVLNNQLVNSTKIHDETTEANEININKIKDEKVIIDNALVKAKKDAPIEVAEIAALAEAITKLNEELSKAEAAKGEFTNAPKATAKLEIAIGEAESKLESKDVQEVKDATTKLTTAIGTFKTDAAAEEAEAGEAAELAEAITKLNEELSKAEDAKGDFTNAPKATAKLDIAIGEAEAKLESKDAQEVKDATTKLTTAIGTFKTDAAAEEAEAGEAAELAEAITKLNEELSKAEDAKGDFTNAPKATAKLDIAIGEAEAKLESKDVQEVKDATTKLTTAIGTFKTDAAAEEAEAGEAAELAEAITKLNEELSKAEAAKGEFTNAPKATAKLEIAIGEAESKLESKEVQEVKDATTKLTTAIGTFKTDAAAEEENGGGESSEENLFFYYQA